MKIKIADIAVQMNNRYPYIESVARNFVYEGEADMTVELTAAELDAVRGEYTEGLDDGYIEAVELYRKIANKLYGFDAFLMHGVAIYYDGYAYIVTAKSGVGKSTHAGLWLQSFGERAHIINGDKPIIRKIGDKFYAAGTPWCGKENLAVNEMIPVRAVAFIERAEKNSAEKISADDAINGMIGQTYMPKESVSALKTLLLFGEFFDTTSFYRLYCNMSPEAAAVAKSVLVDGAQNE